MIWRFIHTGPLCGALNMAVDEALLGSFEPERSAPVLRFYGWEPPTLSLGRFQKAAEVLDLESCLAREVPIVRRITGGGLIYHADELTYSIVCAPGQIPPAASIKDSFRILTSFILRFYAKLGLTASYAVDQAAPGVRLGERTDFCFVGTESHDILINGRKIGGNAQRRLKHVIFQHGSIPLVNHAVEGSSFLRKALPDGPFGTTALAELGVDIAAPHLREVLATAFMETFAVDLAWGDGLTDAEQQRVEELDRDRYRNSDWTMKGETSWG